jgi:excinuclease ABC subunit C
VTDPAAYRPRPGSVPDAPGVYRFSDAEGRVVYVGKAKSLRSRLNSYFGDVATLHPRTQAMVTTAAKVEWTVVATEVEALQLEYSWIKEFDPRFNVRYRDDKSYPYLAVTLHETVPRVLVMRGAKRKGVRYFGPYAHAWAIRETLDLMLRIFPVRTCSNGVFTRAGQVGRPCLLGYIGKCSAPCVGRVTPEEHRAIVADFVAFMEGRTAQFVKRVEREMKAAAAAEEFERAARLRDDLVAMRRALEQNAVVLADGTDADVVALATDPLEVAVCVFHVRGGRVRGQRGWVADRTDDADLPELVTRFLLQLYGDADPGALPRDVLVPAVTADADEHAALESLLTERRGGRVRVRVPQRGDKRALLDTVAQNAGQVLATHKTRRASDLSTRSRALEEIQEILGLDEAPLRIECVDVSHLMGDTVVASLVVFEDGLPRKSDYRRFEIRAGARRSAGDDTAQPAGAPPRGPSDTAAVAEVVTRRFRRYLEEREQAPDPEFADPLDGSGPLDPVTGRPRRFTYAPKLLVVDGGLPQANAAQQALDALGIDDVAVVGLAKRLEELWLPGQDEPLVLSRSSEGLYLLQRLRDEAHRFAITYHRGKRRRTLTTSALDDVPGLGERRRQALLQHFGSVKRLRAAGVDEVAAVAGFGPKLASAVVEALASSTPGPAINTATGEVMDASAANGHDRGDRRIS